LFLFKKIALPLKVEENNKGRAERNKLSGKTRKPTTYF
jgi:hypothetical protein|tara:strand:- start:363 stop:476 length:114 start_codon:yes stop_codon:yes gene_type:complete